MKYCSNREEFKFLTKEELEFNISERLKLLSEMVGTLYPTIINNDLSILRDCLSECGREERWHQHSII